MVEIIKDTEAVTDACIGMNQEQKKVFAEKYYFQGLLPMVYKFCKGTYYLFCYVPNLKEYHTNHLLLYNAFKELGLFVKQNFDINLTIPTSLNLGGLFGGSLNLVIPISS